VLPFPNTLEEAVAAQVVARLALGLELALDHDLRCDTGMVGARHPVGIVALHAVAADQDVHEGLLEGMPHVQRARDVGRRELDAIGLRTGIARMAEIAALLPFGIPASLNAVRVEAFVEFHGGEKRKAAR